MTQKEKKLDIGSLQAMREDAGPLSLLFYGRLFELDPGLRPMFHGDIARQGLKLMEMLAAVVANLNQFESLTSTLHAMGQRHVAYGVLPRHYQVVEDALIWALGQYLEVGPGAGVLNAWRKVIAEVSSTMQAGASQLTPAAET